MINVGKFNAHEYFDVTFGFNNFTQPLKIFSLGQKIAAIPISTFILRYCFILKREMKNFKYENI